MDRNERGQTVEDFSSHDTQLSAMRTPNIGKHFIYVIYV